MRVAVTGARGYLGVAICKALRAQDIEAIQLVRNPGNDTSERAYSLEEAPDADLFNSVDALVHAAYDFSSRDKSYIRKINVDGSINLMNAASRAGVRKIIFISSMSAYGETPSKYGQGKLEVEQVVSQLPGGVSLRPGSIWCEHPRGLTGTLKKLASLPVIPYFSGTGLELFMVHADDVARTVFEILADVLTIPTSKVISCIGGKSVPFKQILLKLSGRARPLMVPIPAMPTFLFLRMLESIGIKPPFASDSFVGLMHCNKNPENPLQQGMRAFD